MNLLAHIYLSGDNDYIKIGNFIADGVRGKNYQHYHKDIQKGIVMHRAIDTYTDAHPIFRQGTKRLHANYGHYSGVIIDLYYDHFLAKNWHLYSDTPLTEYVQDFYELLGSNLDIVPERTQKSYPSMVKGNWLLSYATFEGISDILYQMDYRTQFKSKMSHSHKELQQHYEDYQEEFTSFFEEIQQHVSDITKANSFI